MDKDKVKELVDAHWKYIADLLKIQCIHDQEIKRTEFHYKTAMIHGYKHGWVDAKTDIELPEMAPDIIYDLTEPYQPRPFSDAVKHTSTYYSDTDRNQPIETKE